MIEIFEFIHDLYAIFSRIEVKIAIFSQ